jgi:hypothetical protein
MEKARIFIASSGRTLVLAEKLRDELHTDFCEATLWSEEGKRRPSATIVEMLEKAAQEYNLAVIILARDDVVFREASDSSARKARDNCVFEAGIFMSALGRERCFLANSVAQQDLPSDLGGIISLPFVEPGDLTDREACGQAMRGIAASLKDVIQRSGKTAPPSPQRVPLLSVEEIFQRERHRSDGGDLDEDTVVICDMQPISRPELCVQLRRNLDRGINYIYFLPGTDDVVEKVIQALQIILVAEPGSTGKALDFKTRLETVAKEKDRILEELRRICEMRSLIVSFLPDEPQFRFRLHNAKNAPTARLYLKFHDRGFVQWAEGQEASKIGDLLPKYFPSAEENYLFVPMKYAELKGKEKQFFEDGLDRALSRFFPGIENEVRQLCYRGKETGGARPSSSC